VSITVTGAQRVFLILAGLLGASAVALAALGTHAFSDLLVGPAAARFDIALRLHLAHAPALLALALAMSRLRPRWWSAACALMVLGLLLFCGGLYLAALGIGEWLLPMVPFGGSMLILAWMVLTLATMPSLDPRRTRPPG